MAAYVLDDIPQKYDRAFDRRELEDIIEELNIAHDNVVRIGGIFDAIDRDLDRHRRKIVEGTMEIVDDLVNKRRERLSDVLPMVVDAVYTHIGEDETRRDSRSASRDSDDYIDDQYRNNPLLNKGRDDRRDRDDRGRRDRDGRRDLDRGRYTNRDRGRDRGRRDDGYGSRTSSRSVGGGRNPDDNYGSRGGRARGRLVSGQDDKPREEVETPQETIAPVTGVITSDNVPSTIDVAPIYIIGEEQVEMVDGALEVKPYTGRSSVDYEKHRVDRLFKDVLGNHGLANSNGETLRAIKDAQTALTNTVSAYVNAKDDEGKDIQKINDKLFENDRSFLYEEPSALYGAKLDPLGLRNSILKVHGGNTNWTSHFSLILKAVQRVEVFGANGDTKHHLKALFDVDTMTEFVNALVALVTKIDGADWRFLHDTFTSELNRILVSELSIPTRVGSITSDWNALVDYISKSNAAAAPVLASTGVRRITENVSIFTNEETGEVSIDVKRAFIYLPVSTYDFDLGSATAAQGTGRIVPGTELYNLVNSAYNHKLEGLLTLVTLDGGMLEVAKDSTSLKEVRYYAYVINQ